MRVICAIGQRGGPELIEGLVKIIGNEAECLLLHVIDTGPRHDWKDYLRGPLHRRPHPDKLPHEAAIRSAEEAASRTVIEDAMQAAQRFGFKATEIIKEGQPEKIIIQVAREMEVTLIAIWAREGGAGHPRIGPAALGHTARFVIDHAPCDVLLLREKDN